MRRGVVDRALDLVDDVDVAFSGRGGGLQSLRLRASVIRGGDGDDTGLGPWARRLIDADWKKSDADISCVDGKKGNCLNVGTRALSNASTSI